MKKLMSVLLTVSVALAILACTSNTRYYETAEECIESELNGNSIDLEISGKDTSLICFQLDDAMQFRILAERDDKWHLYLPSFEETAKTVINKGEFSCTVNNLPGSMDFYIQIVEGPTNKTNSREWIVRDSLNTQFYQIVDTHDNYDYVYYLARIPANVKSYDLQINNWIIRDMDLETVWNENESKIEVLD